MDKRGKGLGIAYENEELLVKLMTNPLRLKNT